MPIPSWTYSPFRIKTLLTTLCKSGWRPTPEHPAPASRSGQDSYVSRADPWVDRESYHKIN